MILKSNIPAWFGFGAMTMWPVILMVNPDDAPLVQHEMTHFAEQRWLTPVWGLRYFLSKSFRQAAEIRAHKAEIAAGGDLNACAWRLANKYRLNLTTEQAKILLTT